MTQLEKGHLYKNACSVFPERRIIHRRAEYCAALKTYANIDAKKLKENLIYFLQQVVAVAEELGLKMAIHPDILHSDPWITACGEHGERCPASCSMLRPPPPTPLLCTGILWCSN